MDTDPDQTMLRILELRAYASAKGAVDRAQASGDVDEADPMVRRVVEIQADLLREGMARDRGE